jgi:hypothetical protein
MTTEPKFLFTSPDHTEDCSNFYREFSDDINCYETCPECGAKPEKYAFVEYVESDQ